MDWIFRYALGRCAEIGMKIKNLFAKWLEHFAILNLLFITINSIITIILSFVIIIPNKITLIYLYHLRNNSYYVCVYYPLEIKYKSNYICYINISKQLTLEKSNHNISSSYKCSCCEINIELVIILTRTKSYIKK